MTSAEVMKIFIEYCNANHSKYKTIPELISSFYINHPNARKCTRTTISQDQREDIIQVMESNNCYPNTMADTYMTDGIDGSLLDRLINPITQYSTK